MTIFEAVARIVKERYEQIGQRPVPLVVIQAEIGKYRSVVNPNSLTIAIGCNPSLRQVSKDLFVPRDPEEPTQKRDRPEEDLNRVLKQFQEELNSSG